VATAAGRATVEKLAVREVEATACFAKGMIEFRNMMCVGWQKVLTCVVGILECGDVKLWIWINNLVMVENGEVAGRVTSHDH